MKYSLNSVLLDGVVKHSAMLFDNDETVRFDLEGDYGMITVVIPPKNIELGKMALASLTRGELLRVAGKLYQMLPESDFSSVVIEAEHIEWRSA